MQFSSLYGTELTRELGSADTSQLFTTVRRKAAVNAAQLEWVKRTECLQKESSITLVDETQEYDLEATITDFAWIAKQGPRIQIVNGANTRYIEGKDLIETSVERLDAEEPGWRAVGAGIPGFRYQRRDGGRAFVGLYPAPGISGSETWTLIVPYVIQPADLSGDTDEPFTVSSNVLISLRPWHRALVHYAAYDLEKFRKDVGRQQTQLALWEAEVQKFLANEKPKQGSRMRLATNYRQRVMTRGWRADPRFN